MHRRNYNLCAASERNLPIFLETPNCRVPAKTMRKELVSVRVGGGVRAGGRGSGGGVNLFS